MSILNGPFLPHKPGTKKEVKLLNDLAISCQFTMDSLTSSTRNVERFQDVSNDDLAISCQFTMDIFTS